MQFVLEILLIIIFGVCGLVGNIILIVMFTRLKNNQLKFHQIMILLAIFDTICIVLCILLFALPGLSKGDLTRKCLFYAAPIAIPITQIAITGSVFCRMAISVERYLTVCRPFYVASNNWSAKRYIIPIL